MSENYEPELGQACFGSPAGKYALPRYVEALFNEIRSEIERVYWNANQKEWDQHDDPEIPGIVWRTYWWGDEDDPEAALPNFEFDGAEIRWYKYPGRGMSVNVDWSERRWRRWFDKCIEHVLDYERKEDNAI